MCDMQVIYTLHILTYQSHTCYIVAAHLHPLDGAHNTIVLWHITSLVKCTASILYIYTQYIITLPIGVTHC